MNPNLQNIPVRTEKGRQIRGAFVPRDNDHLFMSADYSQTELRIAASFCQGRNHDRGFQGKGGTSMPLRQQKHLTCR